VVCGLPGTTPPPPTQDLATGLISAAVWQPTATLTIGDWPTGLYTLKLAAANGDQCYLPLVVRDDRRPLQRFIGVGTNSLRAWAG
jgi:hypothetical protein